MRPSTRRAVYGPVPGRPDLKRFLGFEGDPGTGTEPRREVVARRFTGLGGLGGSNASDRGGRTFPGPNGGPGAEMIYDETELWGTNGPAGASAITAPTDPSTPQPPPVDTIQQFDPGISIPFGVSIIKWRNPSTFQSVPILPSTPSNVPVLSLNMQRNALIVQNNSTATSPDVAPNFYIGFNAQPQQGLALTLAPGAGILFDIICPRDAIYVLIAGGTGASQIIQGAVVQGTYAPI